MTLPNSRPALAAVGLTLALFGAAPALAELPEIPGDPITLSCEQLGIPAEYCEADKVDVDLLRQMLVAGPLTGAAMAPLMEAGVFGAPGALPPPPEMEAPAEGEMPKMLMPSFDADSYAEMMAAGVSRTLVVEELGLEVTVPVIDCRFAICLPRGMTGGPAFVSWEEVEMPEMPVMPMHMPAEGEAAEGEGEAAPE
ncbi:MAG: hypothetical protein KDK10_07120 [Maritimibacter sp.]|nr:hypothetical protein [Maritimibacter sp.]